jgi:hypothetical protein
VTQSDAVGGLAAAAVATAPTEKDIHSFQDDHRYVGGGAVGEVEAAPSSRQTDVHCLQTDMAVCALLSLGVASAMAEAVCREATRLLQNFYL